MKTWTVRLGLSLMVALSFWTSRLPAQTLVLAPRDTQVYVVPTVPFVPAYHAPAPPPYALPPVPPPPQHRLQYLLNQHGMACQSNARWGCCGNFYYDFCFVFGSCRNFFSETCFPTAHGFVGPYGGTGYGGAGCGAGGCAR